MTKFSFVKTALLALLFLVLKTSSAQDSIHLAQKIDKDFLRAMQMVYPEFTITEDTLQMVAQLQKVYSLNKYAADEAEKLGVLNNASIKRQLDIALDLQRSRFLADQLKLNLPTKLEITDKEARELYERKKEYLSTMGNVTYVVVLYRSPDPAQHKDGLALLESYRKKGVKSADGFSKMDNGNFTITMDEQIPIIPSQPYYPLFKDAKAGDIKGPLTVYDRTAYILVTTIKPQVVPTYEEVKEQCIQLAREEKILQLDNDRNKKAIQTYPFTFSK